MGFEAIKNQTSIIPRRTPSEVGQKTVMLAEATVYFPSVPEVTPTNPVVTLVQNVAADGQQVETDGGELVDITLSGYLPSGKPLV